MGWERVGEDKDDEGLLFGGGTSMNHSNTMLIIVTWEGDYKTEGTGLGTS